MLELYVGNDNVIELQNLTNVATDVVDTAATVGVTITDRAGNAVTGQSQPIAMSHIGAGTYQGIAANELELKHNRRYVVIVNAAGSGGETGLWRLEATAVNRTA